MSDDHIDEIQQVSGYSPDFHTELANQLQQLAPEVVADGKIDTQKLKELLDTDAADDSERFGLFWPGKKRAIRAAQEPTTATLKPAKDESKDWDITENIFIEGDNLEVLKILQKYYHGRIKMIYIDPPYNTGKDFVYPDNYKEGLASYLEFTKQVDEGGRKLSTNSESEGRYHSNWLNMMYPRLKLARNLLTDDGVIFISIDDNEAANLTKICDEIFGEGNFVADFIWNHRKSSQNDTDVSLSHNYTLAYARNRSTFKLNALGIDESKFANPDNDLRGAWVADPFDAPNVRPNLTYPITNPVTDEQHLPPSGRCWRFSQEKFASALADNRVVWGRTGKGRPQLKRFLSEAREKGKNTFTIWDHIDTATNATKDLMRLFDGRKLFDTPKPVGLIKEILKLSTDGTSIVLDFFSGSGTTGHAVMELNAEDNGSRKHIQVQLPEPVPEDSEAFKAGYKTIAALSEDRLRRAGEKIRKDYEEEISQREIFLDTGFKVYKLADSNFSKWHGESDIDKDTLQQNLLDIRESSNDASSEEDLLTEVLLKQGISLTAKITHEDIGGLSVWNVGDTTVLAYLDEHTKPSLDQLRTMADKEPAKFIILEDAFQGDDELKTNLVQICKTNKIELWTV